jgi:DNA-binding HxlR family transcriptional regulator
MTDNDPQFEENTGCIAHALKIVGNKWTGLLVRELSQEPKRFCDIERALPGISPRTLTQRLRDLEQEQIIARHDSGEYALTHKGTDLIPILDQMVAWGAKHPA